MNRTWREVFAEILSKKIGYYVDPERIIKAERRWIYLPETTDGHPVVLCCSDGKLTVDIPKNDFKKLNEEEYLPEDYIDLSYWCYGFYAGLTASILQGGFFTPLEAGRGISNKDKIYRFLKICFCRVAQDTDRNAPTIRTCYRCPIIKCPVSRYKGNFGNYMNEPGMEDCRNDLLTAISMRVHTDFGYLINMIYPKEDLDDNELILMPYYKADTFNAYVSESLVRSLLYHPLKPYEFADIVRVMNVCLKRDYDSEGYFVFDALQFEHVMKKLDIAEAWKTN